MNSLDLTILLIMAVSITISTFRGGIRELFSLAAVIVGFLLAANFSHYLSEGFLRLTTHKEVNDIIGFVAVFIFAAMLISFIGGRLSEVARKTGLGFWDHMFGTAIGTLKGVVICTLIVYALLVFLPAKSTVLSRSRAFPILSQAAGLVSPIAPQFFRDEYQKKADEIRGVRHPAAKESSEPVPEKNAK